MLPLVFIGGAIAGAAGLLGAALYDRRKTEAQFSDTQDNAYNLTKDEICLMPD